MGPVQELPYWHTTMPALAEHRDRPVPERTEVAVIGGGYTGLTAALSLARAGARVTLLEKDVLGAGASSRNGGIFHPGLKWGRAALERHHGRELGGAVFEAGVASFFEAEAFVRAEGFDCDYRRAGLVVLAWSERHMAGLERELSEFSEIGLHGRIVGRGDLRAEVGTDFYPGGLVLEESSLIHPGRYLAALAGAAERAGVEVHTGVAALGLELGEAERTVATSRGRLVARDVIVATNGYTDGLWPWLRQRVMPIGSYIVATEPLAPDVAASVSPRGRAFFDSKNFLYYWHVNGERRLIFGGRASFRPTSIARAAQILTAALRRVHPQAAGARIEYAWGGNVGFTFDRLPHLGRHDGVHYALGYCGSGLALGTAFGLAVARMVGAADDVARERSPFERIPFSGAPILPAVYRGRPWFLPLAGEWFRAADWWSRRGHVAVGARDRQAVSP